MKLRWLGGFTPAVAERAGQALRWLAGAR